MQDEQNYSNLRQYYRIRYPYSYRPKVTISCDDYESEAVELSEWGVRFLYEGISRLHVGLALKVTIIFDDGESYELAGEILRVEYKDVIVRFSDSLPLSRIIKEQIHLRNNFIGHM